MNSSKKYEMDMCSGPLLSKMMRFAVPLMLSGTLQLLYNAVDTVIVGNFAGTQSLSAVGSTGSIINLLVSVFMGLSIGTSVLTSKAFASNNFDDMQETIHTSVTISVIMGIFVSIIGVILTPTVLSLMNTPDDVIEKSTIYMRIYFIGMPFNMLYNFGSAILRAVGDTKRPLYFLTISGIINVLFNLLLVIVFGLDVAGVAIATVISQAVSAFFVIRCLIKSDGALKLNPKKLSVSKSKLIAILKIGLPAGIQGSFFSISNVLVQSTINSFGSVVMAGNAASASIEGFIFIGMNSMYQTNINFASQNIGAKQYKRARKCLWYCLLLVFIIGSFLSTLAIVFSDSLLKIYNSDPEVIMVGAERMLRVTMFYFLCGMMEVCVGQLRAIGYSLPPMFISLFGVCGIRILWVYLVFPYFSDINVLYLIYPVSWGATVIFLLTTYLILSRKIPKIDEPRPIKT